MSLVLSQRPVKPTHRQVPQLPRYEELLALTSLPNHKRRIDVEINPQATKIDSHVCQLMSRVRPEKRRKEILQALKDGQPRIITLPLDRDVFAKVRHCRRSSVSFRYLIRFARMTRSSQIDEPRYGFESDCDPQLDQIANRFPKVRIYRCPNLYMANATVPLHLAAEFEHYAEVQNIELQPEAYDKLPIPLPPRVGSPDRRPAITRSSFAKEAFDSSKDRDDRLPIRVGIVDTGYDSESVPFSIPIAEFRQFDGNSPTGLVCPPKDADGGNKHGTTILRRLIDPRYGIAPPIELFYAKAADQSGADVSQLSQALDWLIAQDVALINLSIGARPDSPHQPAFTWIFEALLETAEIAGTRLVAAVGNYGALGATIPAALQGVLSVAALYDYNVNLKDEKWEPDPYEQNGHGRSPSGFNPEYAAFGTDFYVSKRSGRTCTSYAAPIVTRRILELAAESGGRAVLADLSALHRNLRNKYVRTCLIGGEQVTVVV